MDENCNPQNHRGYLDTHQALIRDRENSLQDYKSDTRHQSSCCQINSKSKITVCPGGYFYIKGIDNAPALCYNYGRNDRFF